MMAHSQSLNTATHARNGVLSIHGLTVFQMERVIIAAIQMLVISHGAIRQIMSYGVICVMSQSAQVIIFFNNKIIYFGGN